MHPNIASALSPTSDAASEGGDGVNAPVSAPADGPLPPIVCGIDERYLTPLGALMHSIAAAHPDSRGQLRMIVVYQHLREGHRREIDARARRLGLFVELRHCRPGRRYPVSGWVSDAVYLRL